MQKLNIPLSKHTRATRRTRRVVWLPAFVFVFGLFCAWRLATLAFSLPTIASVAPAGTSSFLHLPYSQTSAAELSALLDGIPLISDRSLTSQELMSWSRGELAVFLHEDGSRSVAIRASLDLLPQQLLDAYGLTAQESGNFVLLSETLLPISGIDARSQAPFFPSLSTAWLGTFWGTEETTIQLLSTTSGILLQEETQKQPVSAAAHNSNHELSLDLLPFSFSDDIPAGFHRFYGDLYQQFSTSTTPFSSLSPESVSIISRFEDTSELLFVLNGVEGSISDALLVEMQLLGALMRPSLVSRQHSDSTSYQELLVRPDLVSVEEFSLLGSLGYRVQGSGDTQLLALVHDESVLVTDSMNLLEDYVTLEHEAFSCSGNLGHMNPATLLSQVQLSTYSGEYAVIHQIFSQFSLISVENEKYSRIIQLCY